MGAHPCLVSEWSAPFALFGLFCVVLPMVCSLQLQTSFDHCLQVCHRYAHEVHLLSARFTRRLAMPTSFFLATCMFSSTRHLFQPCCFPSTPPPQCAIVFLRPASNHVPLVLDPSNHSITSAYPHAYYMLYSIGSQIRNSLIMLTCFYKVKRWPLRK